MSNNLEIAIIVWCVCNIVWMVINMFRSSVNNKQLQEGIDNCKTMLINPPTENCKLFYNGKLAGLELAQSLLQEENKRKEG